MNKEVELLLLQIHGTRFEHDAEKTDSEKIIRHIQRIVRVLLWHTGLCAM
jgi:hypothetical protein